MTDEIDIHNAFLPAPQGVTSERIDTDALTARLDGINLTPALLFEIRILLEAREYNKDRIDDVIEARNDVPEEDDGGAFDRYTAQLMSLLNHRRSIRDRLGELGYA